MSLTKPFTSQIDTTDIEQTAFASSTQVNSVAANLDAFASYANSTFSTGEGGGTATGNGVVFSDTFTTSNVSSNEFSLSANVAYGENLLVYLNGLLQHPDAYTVSANTLTLINSDPLPSGLKVSVRELSVAGGVANVALANVAEARASNAANGTLTFDYEGSNLYVYDGSAVGGYFLPLTQAVITVPEWTFQGSVSGYTSGGNPVSNVIDKFPFAVDGNATDVGDLTQARTELTGQSSSTSGYSTGGKTPTTVNTIDKFSFSADGNATDVGDLTQARNGSSGQSSSTSGYTSGGEGAVNTIDKFPFSADGNATDVGDLTVAKAYPSGQNSAENGYSSGATTPPTALNVIDKFPFSVDANATDVGDLTISRGRTAGQSSSTFGYVSGGSNPPTTYNTIDKFSFSNDANATDVGDLTVGRYAVSGQSSDTSGYTSGGFAPTVTPNTNNTIDKFPFATDGNATDVGDMTISRFYAAGQQV